MQRNKSSIDIETGNSYYDNVDTGESIYFIFTGQQEYTKKLMSKEFQFFDSYEDYIVNYLTQIEGKSSDVLHMLYDKNTNIIFVSIQSVFSTNRTTSKINKTYCNSRR